MNKQSPLPPDDPEILLRSGLRDTTPEFERRWTDLKRTLRQEPPSRRRTFARRWWWSLLPAGAAAAAVWLLVVAPRATGPGDSPSAAEIAAFDELFALDADLRSALPLTDRESVDDLLSIPVTSTDHS